MRLLFITQKLHQQDAFAILWVNEFRRQGYDVTVLCLEDRVSPQLFKIHSMGKEKGYGKFRQMMEFERLITSLSYDRVFIHMSPIWGLLGFWWFALRRIPTYLWYTHYKQSFSMRVTGWYAKRLFCATPQSLPQYEGSPKKVVVGHGIDLAVWPMRPNLAAARQELLIVHRLSRSKRLELSIQALTLLPKEYTMVVYGIPAEQDYVAELQRLVLELQLQDRVMFKGTIPMEQLPAIYQHHHLILNMASETIDKTMLEAMTCGCYPMTTKRNAEAIGIHMAPSQDTPEAIATFIQSFKAIDADQLHKVVEERHSLKGLVEKMDKYIRQGS